MSEWRVMVVEDDPAVARYHELLVQRTPGFTVVGNVDTAELAISMADRTAPDLILLDLALPGRDGLTLLRHLRGRGRTVEVIAISAHRQTSVVRSAVHLGVVDYLVKPFPPERLRQALRLFVNRMTAASAPELDQAQVDLLTAGGRVARRSVPKGLDAARVEHVRRALRGISGPVTAQELAERMQLSRVTVRRYLEYLAATGEAKVVSLPGVTGRPRNGYTLFAEPSPSGAGVSLL
jgi:response regulator of citrate/malate metabolism